MLEVNELRSGVLINDGAGRFDFHPLPAEAQVAPSFGAVLTDVNADGDLDLYMVHNFFSPQVETGRHDGGLSLLLFGDGHGGFLPVAPYRSGLVVPGDARSVVVTDIDQDDRPDFLVGINNSQLLAFRNTGMSGSSLDPALSSTNLFPSLSDPEVLP